MLKEKFPNIKAHEWLQKREKSVFFKLEDFEIYFQAIITPVKIKCFGNIISVSMTKSMINERLQLSLRNSLNV